MSLLHVVNQSDRGGVQRQTVKELRNGSEGFSLRVFSLNGK